MKSIDQIKDEVAQKHCLKDWNDLIEYHTTQKYKDLSPLITEYYDELVEAYAEEKANDAWDRACEAQRKVCADEILVESNPRLNQLANDIKYIVENAPKPQYEP